MGLHVFVRWPLVLYWPDAIVHFMCLVSRKLKERGGSNQNIMDWTLWTFLGLFQTNQIAKDDWRTRPSTTTQWAALKFSQLRWEMSFSNNKVKNTSFDPIFVCSALSMIHEVWLLSQPIKSIFREFFKSSLWPQRTHIGDSFLIQ